MTFDEHRSLLSEVPYANAGYHLSGIQSAAWHARDREGEVVRSEIRAAAATRRTSIYDVDGKLLEASTLVVADDEARSQHGDGEAEP